MRDVSPSKEDLQQTMSAEDNKAETTDAAKYSYLRIQQQIELLGGQKPGPMGVSVGQAAGLCDDIFGDEDEQNKYAMLRGERFRAGANPSEQTSQQQQEQEEEQQQQQQQQDQQQPNEQQQQQPSQQQQANAGNPQVYVPTVDNPQIQQRLNEIAQNNNRPRPTMNYLANSDLDSEIRLREHQIAMATGYPSGCPMAPLGTSTYPMGGIYPPPMQTPAMYMGGYANPGMASMMPGAYFGVQPPTAMGNPYATAGQVNPGGYYSQASSHPWAPMPPAQCNPNGITGFNQGPPPPPPPAGGGSGPQVSSNDGRLLGGYNTDRRGSGRQAAAGQGQGGNGARQSAPANGNQAQAPANRNAVAPFGCFGQGPPGAPFAAGGDNPSVVNFLMAPPGLQRQGSNDSNGQSVAQQLLAPINPHAVYQTMSRAGPLIKQLPIRNLDETLGIGRGWPYVTARGTIALRLSGHKMVEMTCDKAIRVVSYDHNILVAIDASGMCAAMVHPNGRIHQHNARVEIVAYEDDGNHKYAKMWYKGVSFTSERCALVYLVDEGGTRTTSDRFSPQLHAPAFATSTVFLSGSCHSCEPAFTQCYAILQETYDYYKSRNGNDVWVINGIKITQTEDQTVTIFRDTREGTRFVRRKIKTSPENGSAFVSTPMVHASASMGQNPHLFVRRGERRLHKDETSFIVRNGGHSSGFDDRGRLKVL